MSIKKVEDISIGYLSICLGIGLNKVQQGSHEFQSIYGRSHLWEVDLMIEFSRMGLLQNLCLISAALN